MKKFDALYKDIMSTGLSKGKSTKDIDPKELKKGEKDEYEEHFHNPSEKNPELIKKAKKLAHKTSLDHILGVDKKYYTKLDKMGL